MERTKTYYIKELKDKTKKIKIICFYDDSILYYGNFDKIPKIFIDCPCKIFTPYKDYYEFII
jgi:hypothetical protein